MYIAIFIRFYFLVSKQNLTFFLFILQNRTPKSDVAKRFPDCIDISSPDKKTCASPLGNHNGLVPLSPAPNGSVPPSPPNGSVPTPTSSSGTAFQCSLCGYGSDESEALRLHVTNSHPNCSQFQCDQCPDIYGSFTDIVKHVAKVHNYKEFKNYRKEMKLINERLMSEPYKKEVLGVPVFDCSECSSRFKKWMELKIHMKNEHNLSGYKCTKCNYKPYDMSTLRKHYISNHCKSQVYKCLFCDYSCGQANPVVLHANAKHNFPEPYKCGRCSFTTGVLGRLRNHFNIHVETDGYQCGYCPSSFSEPAQIKSHFQTEHNFNRIYKCPLCAFTSGCLQDSRLHEGLAHTQNKPFKCSMCPFCTSALKTFKTHALVAHSEIDHTICLATENNHLSDGISDDDSTTLVDKVSKNNSTDVIPVNVSPRRSFKNLISTCPSKHTTSPSNSVTPVTESNEINPVRIRKDMVETTPIAAKSSKPQTVKRGRGRPRKNPLKKRNTSTPTNTSKFSQPKSEETKNLNQSASESLPDLPSVNESRSFQCKLCSYTSLSEPPLYNHIQLFHRVEPSLCAEFVSHAVSLPEIFPENRLPETVQEISVEPDIEMKSEQSPAVVNQNNGNYLSDDDDGNDYDTFHGNFMYSSNSLIPVTAEEVSNHLADLNDTNLESSSASSDEDDGFLAAPDYDSDNDYDAAVPNVDVKSHAQQQHTVPSAEDIWAKHWECLLCNFIAYAPKELFIHMESEHLEIPGRKKCTRCNFVAEDLERLKFHNAASHDGDEDCFCGFCGQLFANADQLRLHVDKRHNVKGDFQCFHCNYVNKNLAELRRHLVTDHTRDGGFQGICEFCEFETEDRIEMAKHVRISHPAEKQFKCSFCSYSTNHSFVMKRHIMAIHKKIKPFKCPYCPYSSARKDNLNSHMKIHRSL